MEQQKIFISYNHNDDVIVDMISRRLELEFGRNNIFYDKWSIQPGDSIIGKMNEGLESFTTFFFFISPNSLSSKMVSLEWQTALNRAVNNDLKFIAVRIADCDPPAILSDNVYIDLYGEGYDSAVEKMRCIVKSESTYKPLEDVQNLSAEISMIKPNSYEVNVYAKYFSENSTTFLFACDKDINDFVLCLTGSFLCGQNIISFDNGRTLNARTLTPMHMNVKPGFPLNFIVDTNSPLTECYLFKLINASGTCEKIPLDIKFR